MILGYDRLPHIEAVILELDDLVAIHTNKVPVSRVIGKIWIIEGGGLADADLPN